MKANGLALRALLSCALATPVAAQVHQIAFEWDASQPHMAPARKPVDTCVAASANRVIVAANQTLILFDRSGNELDRVDVRIPDTTPPIDPTGLPNPDFIFKGAAFIDPRVEYDRYSGRFWLIYLAGESSGEKTIHLAISESSQPEGFDRAGTVDPGEGWHVYTSESGYPAPFNPASTSIGQQAFEGKADHPAISFGSNFMYLMAVDQHAHPTIFDNKTASGVIIFPRTHDGGAKSILNGERPADSDLAGIELEKLQFPLRPDDQYFHCPVQEPFEDVAGQFYIVTAKGVRCNSGTGEWEYVFKDMDLPAADDSFYNPSQPAPTEPALPATPAGDSTWEIGTIATKFDSAWLCRDVTGALKVFAANYVVAAEGQALDPVDRHEFRWYVIDPDLSNFPGASWDPQIEVVGAAPTGGIAGAETYEGAISVNAAGVAYITFTRSGTGASGWPSLVRALLSNNYATSTIVAQFGQAGPDQWYDDGGSAARGLGLDYCDMQPDYLHCGHWGVGTIGAFADGEPEPPVITTARAVWVTEIPIDCPANAAEMNGDGTVDTADLALYLEYYAAEDQRADMDRSGTITTVDYQIYSDEYAKR